MDSRPLRIFGLLPNEKAGEVGLWACNPVRGGRSCRLRLARPSLEEANLGEGARRTQLAGCDLKDRFIGGSRRNALGACQKGCCSLAMILKRLTWRRSKLKVGRVPKFAENTINAVYPTRGSLDIPFQMGCRGVFFRIDMEFVSSVFLVFLLKLIYL